MIYRSSVIVYNFLDWQVHQLSSGRKMTELWGGLSLPWSPATNLAVLAEFSALCFLFGRHLADTLHVPVNNAPAKFCTPVSIIR